LGKGERIQQAMSNVIRTLQILRESISSDEEYLTAVSMGNELRAQALVDEAAKKAGYNFSWPYAYHGTESDTFYTFDMEGVANADNVDEGAGYFFTDDAGEARWFTAPQTDLMGSRGKPSPHSRVLKVFLRSPKSMEFDTQSDFRAYVNVEAPYVKGRTPGYGFRNLLSKQGYTGVKIHDSQLGGGEWGNGTWYIVFSPEQIKLADPVTYDDDGDVIPLSERFNPNSNDIRY